MKYEVTFSCGHTHTVELFGKTSDRERKIKYYETYGVCPDCYKAQKTAEMAKDCDEVVMFYGDYKNYYADCNTKPGSYDSKAKTIVVYVPRKQDAHAKESAQPQQAEAADEPSQSEAPAADDHAAQHRASILATIDEAQAAFTPEQRQHPKFAQINDRFERIRAAVVACTSTADLLACYGAIHAYDPYSAREQAFTKILLKATPANDTQRSLLGL